MIVGKGGLNALVKTRLDQSLLRILYLHSVNTEHVTRLKKSNPNINLSIYQYIYPQIASGYNKAYIHDMEYYHAAFCNKFDISLDDESSVFAFYNELLLEDGKRDLEKARIASLDYFNNLGKDQIKIIPEFLIDQISRAHLYQCIVSKQLQSFIPSKK